MGMCVWQGENTQFMLCAADLSKVDRRLEARQYLTIGEFIKDITKIFDNCRYYNTTDSAFYQCAEVLETHFTQKLKALKEQVL